MGVEDSRSRCHRHVSSCVSKGLPSEHGIVLLIVLLAMVLLTALGLSLTVVTSTEARIAAVHRDGLEAFYAADAALEQVVHELSFVSDWTRVLDGTVTSSFVDGGVASRPWPGGRARTSGQATALVTCGRLTCSSAEVEARTTERPWGANNPRWRLFAYGPFEALGGPGAIGSAAYVAIWVGDDPSENDGNPLVDGGETAGANPGRGLLTVLAHGYVRSTIRSIEATVRQTARGVHVISWRENR